MLLFGRLGFYSREIVITTQRREVLSLDIIKYSRLLVDVFHASTKGEEGNACLEAAIYFHFLVGCIK